MKTSFFTVKNVARARGLLLPACVAGVIAGLPLRAADPEVASPAASAGDGSLPTLFPSSDLKPLPDFASDVDTSTAAAPAPATPAEAPAASSPPAAPPPESAGATSASSENVTVNLIHLMVKRGLITKTDADKLIKQAENEALEAHEQAVIAQARASSPLPSPSGPASSETSPAQEAGSEPLPGGAPAAAVPADEEDTVRVTYVPDVVKQQLRSEIKQDVMEEAREENWGPSDALPDWVHRFHVTGDIRVREEYDVYPPGNADGLGDFVNFNAINTGSPFDFNTNTNPDFRQPAYNVNEDRERIRLRARIGAGVDLGNNFTAGIRIGTGQDNNPVTENQTIGLANNGQGGNFSKYAIWLDRAFISYDVWGEPDKDITFTVGRFDNPFFSTPLIWSNDIGFDGGVVKAKYEVTPGVTPFVTGGFFPVFNTDYNFSSTDAAKFSSEDKYLFAGQAGTTWKINQDFTFLGAVAIYDFENIEGKVSDPFIATSAADQGDTDDSRPSFAQNGNTYIALRNLEIPPGGSVATTPDYQYFGLATPFQELALTGQLDFSRFDPFHISLVGEVVKNLAFNTGDITNNGPPDVNQGPQNNLGSNGAFEGGDLGAYIGLVLGRVDLEKLGDWNVNLNYRYLESDAVVDAFTDSDFGADLTGTNLQGYTLEGNVALAQRVWLKLRFMSADAIAGPPYQNDLVQFDINAKF